MSTVLKDIGVYKNNLLSLFLNSNDIMELILGKGFTEEDVWGKDDDDEDYGIIYKNVFPYLYVDDTRTEVETYLCCEVDVPRVPTSSIKDGKIIIWAYSSKGCMKYSKKGYLGTRPDILADMIERSIRNYEDGIRKKAKTEKVKDVNGIGIGNVHLDSVTHRNWGNSHYGVQMIFTISDFKVKE